MNTYQKPFLKWVGGKFKQLNFIQSLMPEGNRLIEPFAGAGSVFINSPQFKEYIISDINGDLINTYKQLCDDYTAVLSKTSYLFDNCKTESEYMAVRSKFNEMRYTASERASAFIYLNKWCFNGLVRYNKKGEFNVGFGHRTENPPPAPLFEMLAFSNLEIPSSSFFSNDFVTTIRKAGVGDVVFADPPYLATGKSKHKNGNTKYKIYTGDHFDIDDHETLVSELIDANKRGAKIIVCNSMTELSESMYKNAGFETCPMTATRTISCNGKDRGKAKDLLARLL